MRSVRHAAANRCGLLRGGLAGLGLLGLLGLGMTGATALARADEPPPYLARTSPPSQSEAAGWLGGLYDRAARDLAAGRPLVIQAHVALCDNSVVACGAQGDGGDIRRNLYWTTSGGTVGWFRRQQGFWHEVYRGPGPLPDVLEVRVYRALPAPAPAWRQRGVERRMPVYLVAYAWRGTAIDAALRAYVTDLFHSSPRPLRIEDGTELSAGGAAHIVAWVGHNRFMDWPVGEIMGLFQSERQQRDRGAAPKGLIAIACRSASYLGATAGDAQRVPMLLTNDLLFAGSHALDGAVRAFLAGEGLAEIRQSAAAAYARGQGKPVERVRAAFINPADRRWRW